MNNNKITPIERPLSLCDIAVERIRNAIINGSYQLGEPLSESKLVETLGISKTPIREAILILKLEGLISVIPQKGTFVFTLGIDEVMKLGHYRYTLESFAIEMSNANNSEHLISDLSKICSLMTQAHNKDKRNEYLELDTKFHEAIFKYCENKYLKDGYKQISGKVAAVRTHLSLRPHHTDKSLQEHLVIVELLKNGEIEEVKSVLKKHITRGERSYPETVEDIANI